jgi:hypothetical protein
MTTSSTTDTYAYTAGLEAGRSFLDPEPSLERVFARERREMARERRDAAIELEKLELKRGWRERQLTAADDRHGSRSALLDRLTDEMDEKPAAYSRIRGILYIGFAILILIADFAILAQVISRVFGFTARAKGLGNPASALFKDPVAAIETFGEVYLTTVGVLLIAMAFKVWNDRAPRKPLPPGARPADRIARFLEDHTQWIVLAVAVVSVVVIAYVRVQVDVGRMASTANAAPRDNEHLLRWVTAIIGLACPVVGVLLFSRGLEALGAGQRLKSLDRTASRLGKKADALRNEWEDHTQVRVEKEIVKRFLDLPEEEQQRLCLAEDQFRLGYVAGVAETLGSAGPKGTYRSLRLRFPVR